MAALLVGLSVMAVLMGALLPVWSHMVTREKEDELIFRGNQYARAIGLFQRKFANTAPPTIDVLVEQRYLRKKYKDPITKDDFQPIYATQAAQGVSAPLGAARPGQTATALPQPTSPQTGSTGVPGAQGGIIGVTSKSKERSIKLYNGRDKYNEWAFVYIQTSQRAGGPVGAGGAPGASQRGPGATGLPGQQQGLPGPFGMPQGSFPGSSGQRPGVGPGPGASQPGRPPVPGQPPGAIRRPGA